MKVRIIKIADIVTEYALYLMLFFIPISKAALEISFGIILLAFLVKKSLNPDFSFLKSRVNFFLLLFFVFCALSLFNSGPLLLKSTRALVTKWGKLFLLFLFLQEAFAKKGRIIKIGLLVLLGSSFLAGVDAISQRFFGLEFFRHRPLVSVGSVQLAVTSGFNWFNDFGAYLILPLSLAFSIMVSKRAKISFRIMALFLAALLCWAMLMTFSRGSWLGLAFSVLLILVFSGRVKLLFAAVFVLLLVLLLAPEVRDRVLFTFQGAGDSGRRDIWHNALIMLKDNPFLGKGIGTFMDHYPRYSKAGEALYAHNCYLQVWAETGIFSLLSLLLFLGALIYSSFKKLIVKEDYLFLGLLCGICGFLLHSFFDTNFYSLQLSFLFWVSLAILKSGGSQA